MYPTSDKSDKTDHSLNGPPMLAECYKAIAITLGTKRVVSTTTEYLDSGSFFVHKLYRISGLEVFIQECHTRQGYFERHRFVRRNGTWDGGSRIIPGSHSWHPQRGPQPELIDYE